MVEEEKMGRPLCPTRALAVGESRRMIVRDGKLGVAVHGAGWVAGAHVASWLKNPHVAIVSISDIDPDRARQLAERHGLSCSIRRDYGEVLADASVDIVDVTGPSHVHAEHGIAAAATGKHVLVEKPIALSMEENRALRDAVAKAGVKSLASFCLRWNPAVQMIKSLVQSGAIGDLIYVETDYWHGMGQAHHAWNLHSRKLTAGSALLLAGCHAVDALRWLTGDEVEEVSASSNNRKGLFEFDANVVAVVKFRSGIIGKVSALLDCEMPYAFNMDLAGTEGTIRDDRIWSKKLFPGQTGWARCPTILPDSGAVHHHPFEGEINHFVRCILEDRQSHCNIADAYRSHELCMAIDQSLQLRQPVKLPLDGV